jgi:hypothetical protein
MSYSSRICSHCRYDNQINDSAYCAKCTQPLSSVISPPSGSTFTPKPASLPPLPDRPVRRKNPHPANTILGRVETINSYSEPPAIRLQQFISRSIATVICFLLFRGLIFALQGNCQPQLLMRLIAYVMYVAFALGLLMTAVMLMLGIKKRVPIFKFVWSSTFIILKILKAIVMSIFMVTEHIFTCDDPIQITDLQIVPELELQGSIPKKSVRIKGHLNTSIQEGNLVEIHGRNNCGTLIFKSGRNLDTGAAIRVRRR